MTQINLDPKLYGRLPIDLIREHIMPFAYKPQPKTLLFDIRSFHTDWFVVKQFYNLDENNYCNISCMLLHYELCAFCSRILQDTTYNDINGELCKNIDETSYKDILNRYITKDKRSDDLSILIKKILFVCVISYPGKRERYKKICHNLWILFGILTPNQRTAFINNYILNDYL